MGQPKLLLPLGESTVITRLLETLRVPEVTDIVIVMRRGDQDLFNEVQESGATIVQPDVDPPDMRDSVEHAIEAIRKKHAPRPEDGWLLIPADHPILDRACLLELIAEWKRQSKEILIPTHEGRRGHPTFLSWSLADQVASTPSDKGLNWLVRRHEDETELFESSNHSVVVDLDTPEDYERLTKHS